MNRLFEVPESDSKGKSWQKLLLLQTLGFTILCTIFNMSYMFVRGQEYDYGIDLLMLAAQFALLWMARRGHHRTAAITLIVTLWLFFTAGIDDYTSIMSPFFNMYIILVLIAGLIIGGRAAAITAVVSILAGFLSLLTNRTPEAETMLLYISTLMLTAAYMLTKMNSGIRTAFSEAREKQAALEQTNQRLQAEILERHKIEATLKESEARYRNLLDFASTCVVVNSLEGEILYANPYAAKIFGAEEAQNLIGTSSWNLFTPETRELMRQRMEILKHGDKTPLVECDVLTLDGRPITIEVSSMPIQYEGQAAVLAIINDVTERNLAQSARLEAETLSMALEKERQYGQLRDDFITMMSHEFRTPLSVINSSKDLLERYDGRMTADKRAAHFDKIGTQISSMVEMLDAMLTLSQATAGILPFSPQTRNVVSICREVFETYQDEDRTHHTMTFATDVPMLEATFDERMLRTIVANLLLDAQHHTADDGTITMRICHERQNSLTIKISDNGQPLSDEAREHVFQPFFYHDDPLISRGTGLNMAIASQYVEAHSGSISCENGTDGGITYTVTLPLNQTADERQLHPV